MGLNPNQAQVNVPVNILDNSKNEFSETLGRNEFMEYLMKDLKEALQVNNRLHNRMEEFKGSFEKIEELKTNDSRHEQKISEFTGALGELKDGLRTQEDSIRIIQSQIYEMMEKSQKDENIQSEKEKVDENQNIEENNHTFERPEKHEMHERHERHERPERSEIIECLEESSLEDSKRTEEGDFNEVNDNRDFEIRQRRREDVEIQDIQDEDDDDDDVQKTSEVSQNHDSSIITNVVEEGKKSEKPKRKKTRSTSKKFRSIKK